MNEMTPRTRNPYPGLRPFGPDDEEVFFGRRSEADEILRRLDTERFLAVVGPPGSGKTSLVRAGLLPAFRDVGGITHIVVLRPGPGLLNRFARELVRIFPSTNILESETLRCDRLAADMCKGQDVVGAFVRDTGAGDGQRCVLCVDPFEELLYRGDPEENAAFVQTLLEAAHDERVPLRVLVTLGSDFLADCARFKGLPDVLQEGRHFIAEPGEEALREMIEGPARATGATVAPVVVERMLRELEDEREPLPALQYLSQRIWDAGPAAFDAAEYESMGGVAEAVSVGAERALGELAGEEQELARKIFQCITYKVPDHRAVSWPTRLDEIAAVTGAAESSVRRVIEALRAANPDLVAPGSSVALTSETPIEILHDSLIRRWHTLGAWVEEEDAAASTYRALVRSAERHALGRAGLWRGPVLEFAAEKIERREWNAAWAARLGGNYYAAVSFLEESLRAEGASREGKSAGGSLVRARLLAAACAFLCVAALGVALYFYERQHDAIVQREEAERLLAEARELNAAAARRLDRAHLEKGSADLQRSAAIREKEIAERLRKIAESRRAIAENQQRIAESRSGAAAMSDRQRLYVANMNLASSAFGQGDFVRGQELLGEYAPATMSGQTGSGEENVRDFFWYYLWRENHDEIATLDAHESTVATVAFSPDGKLIATGGQDGKVMLWDAASRALQGTLEASGHAVAAVAFSPDGNLVAAAARGGGITLWRSSSRERAAALAAGEDLSAMAFLPDGARLAVGGREGAVAVWDLAQRTKVFSLEGHERDVYALAVSPDGRILASGSQDDTVRLWNLETRKQVARLEGNGDDIHALAFAPDGKSLAAGSKNGPVQLWDVARRKELASLSGAEGDVYTVAFSPDGRVLAAGSRNGTVRLWDVARRETIDILKGHGDAVVAVALAPGGGLLVTGSRDGTAKLWRLERARAQTAFSGQTPIFAVAFDPTGEKLAMGSVADTVRLWNLENRSASTTLEGSGDVLFALAFSPDGGLLATGSKDGTAKLWDVNAAQEKNVLEGHEAAVFSVAFSPDGGTLATGSWDHAITLWDTASGQQRARLEGHDDAVFSVAFSPDGKLLATGSKDATVRLWDAVAAEPLATLAGHADAVFPVAFSRNGAQLASASRDGVVKLWDVERREELAAIPAHGDSVSALSFSPDGRLLATGSLDDTVKLWDLATRRELATLEGHTKDVYAVAFSPDGRLLASGSLDGSVRLWESATDADVARQH